jgi:hypothetical protein
MATDLKELTTAAQENVLSVIKMTQTSMVEAVKTVVDTVDKFTPDFPIPSVPGLDLLPSPTEGLTMTFSFAEKLLENQKDFASSLIAALSPTPVKAAKAAAAPKAS